MTLCHWIKTDRYENICVSEGSKFIALISSRKILLCELCTTQDFGGVRPCWIIASHTSHPSSFGFLGDLYLLTCDQQIPRLMLWSLEHSESQKRVEAEGEPETPPILSCTSSSACSTVVTQMVSREKKMFTLHEDFTMNLWSIDHTTTALSLCRLLGLRPHVCAARWISDKVILLAIHQKNTPSFSWIYLDEEKKEKSLVTTEKNVYSPAEIPPMSLTDVCTTPQIDLHDLELDLSTQLLQKPWMTLSEPASTTFLLTRTLLSGDNTALHNFLYVLDPDQVRKNLKKAPLGAVLLLLHQCTHEIQNVSLPPEKKTSVLHWIYEALRLHGLALRNYPQFHSLSSALRSVLEEFVQHARFIQCFNERLDVLCALSRERNKKKEFKNERKKAVKKFLLLPKGQLCPI